MNGIVTAVVTMFCVASVCHGQSTFDKNQSPLYTNSLATRNSVDGWKMEGPGEVIFENGWMQMSSPNMEMHHVFWCPFLVPKDFIAEWEVQNQHPQSGLLIVFFSASGLREQDILDPSLRDRDGTFSQYTNGDIQSYHLSYYANSINKPNRNTIHLRKNPGFHLLAESGSPIPSESESVHRVRLEKNGTQIEFFIDGIKVLHWSDDSGNYGPVLSAGKIGFRQMRSSVFLYRNLRIFAGSGDSD